MKKILLSPILFLFFVVPLYAAENLYAPLRDNPEKYSKHGPIFFGNGPIMPGNHPLSSRYLTEEEIETAIDEVLYDNEYDELSREEFLDEVVEAVDKSVGLYLTDEAIVQIRKKAAIEYDSQ